MPTLLYAIEVAVSGGSSPERSQVALDRRLELLPVHELEDLEPRLRRAEEEAVVDADARRRRSARSSFDAARSALSSSSFDASRRLSSSGAAGAPVAGRLSFSCRALRRIWRSSSAARAAWSRMRRLSSIVSSESARFS